MALMDDATVLAQLGAIDPGSPTITFLREGAEAAIKNFVGWGIEEDTVTRYYDGSGQNLLVLRDLMFVQASGLRVWVDQAGSYGQNASAFGSGTELTIGTHFGLVIDAKDGSSSRSGTLTKLGNTGSYPSDFAGGFSRGRRGLSYLLEPVWQKGRGNVKVTATYGFGTCPADLQMWIVQSCRIFQQLIQRGVMVTSESLGDYNWSGSFNQLPEFADIRKGLLKGYGDWGV